MRKYKDLISLKEAAQEFGMSPTSLRVYIHQKRLEAIKKGRDWMTTKEAVQEYLRNRERKREPKR